MNSYNENLHSSVLSSLESQEMTKKQLSSQLSNSMFTLYYAEGAEIVAQEKLDATTKMYTEKQHINDVVVKNKNMADNLLLSANQQKTYVTQAVTNMAVCASNIQIASNSIVRLASDIGSIYSIVNAADYGTQIYQQTLEAYNLINKTAYNAERTSQYAMEATAAISEVSSSTVADGAKLTNTSVNNLLQVTTSDLTAITAVLTVDNDTKSKASIATRAAEGAIKCSEVEYDAAKKAYTFNNAQFNQNLVVEVPKLFDPSSGNFNVSFNAYRSPFSADDRNPDTQNVGLKKPVLSYNIILVKDSKKSLFSASVAEDLVGNPAQCKSIPATQTPDAQGKYTETLAYKQYRDSDNDPLVLGENYVAFLLIMFTESYKKEINTFDEYLSAPSEVFSLTYTLKNAKHIGASRENGSEDLSKITFSVEKEEVLKPAEIDYRCFFLPYPDDMATNEDLDTLESKIETLELEEEIKTVEAEIKSFNEEIENLNASANQPNAEGGKNAKDADQEKQKSASLKSALTDTKEKLRLAKSQLADLNTKLKDVKDKSPKPVKNTNAFFFNLNLAENIPAGNFTNAKQHRTASGHEFLVDIDTTTTDNFGNPLVEDKNYIPVVLSYYKGTENSRSKYTNSLSDWQNTPPIPYSTKETLKSSTL
ncbi:hypothetical protein JI750_21815 [Flavobacterium sp. GN10]|uniref:Uncharacterized protein n=1 Tax=Flavobacterium tagetis TaxID=2801336 RepID=A0ABS1KJ99_9FLAO|nr:hypothetical protein [Flavobacterium tagetis]MBL0739544.1 hypothetical protein [Flavobacterium tagetis]